MKPSTHLLINWLEQHQFSKCFFSALDNGNGRDSCKNRQLTTTNI